MVSTSLKTADLVRTLRLHKSEEKYLEIISRIVHLPGPGNKDRRSALYQELRKHLSDKRVDEIYDRIVKLQNSPS